jgi:acyl-CoA thioesterase-1
MQMEAPPNLGPRYTSAFRAMFPAVAREGGAALVPFLLDGVAGVQEMNQSDGIHPNERGSVHVAENVWKALEPTLRDLRQSSPKQ